jgi:hypothetical protein
MLCDLAVSPVPGVVVFCPRTNGYVNSCVNSPENGPVGPKHVEIRRYMNKIEIVTSVGFSFHMVKGCTVQKA